MVSRINLQRSIPKKQVFPLQKVIILGNFNIQAENKVMKYFLQEHMFYNMVKEV